MASRACCADKERGKGESNDGEGVVGPTTHKPSSDPGRKGRVMREW